MTPSELREKPKKNTRIIAGILAFILAAAIFVFSCIPGSSLLPGHPDILNTIAHFCLYLLLAISLVITLNSARRALWLSGAVALGIASLYGVSDEIHQLFTPGRSSDPLDWLTDTLGALLGVVIVVLVISARQVRRSRQRDSQR
ncbi:MAG: VanZ family protein [Actinomycetia bacterium]|nr:VanZ family protein [Actinomycetes bacterium]